VWKDLVAGVSGRDQSILVGLHHVHLGAVGPSRLVGLAVVLSISSGDRLLVPVVGQHGGSVKGIIARTANSAQVHTKLQSLVEEIDLVERATPEQENSGLVSYSCKSVQGTSRIQQTTDSLSVFLVC